MEKLETGIKTVFSEIEKVFRYFVPGVVFLILMKLSGLDAKHSIIIYFDKTYTYFLGFVLGLVIYSIYRVIVFVVIDEMFLCKKIEYKDLIEYMNEKNNKYANYRSSLVHSVMITSILLIIFTCLSVKGSVIIEYKKHLIIASGIWLVIALIEMYRLLKVTAKSVEAYAAKSKSVEK